MLGRLLRAACAGVLTACVFAYGPIASAQQRPQPQQQTEPRIAFVVGNAGYQRGPIPQALNDAGLVAEALRSIGFEIVEGADLRQPDILRNFRDFLDKVQAAGPDAIAFVYFSGYGLSFEGDNYLVGADARLDRESDIAIEAVRLSDLMRSLGESPARAKVMIIDAARPSPFTPQGRGLAKGLAAVEPPQGMLIAFSNAPGSVAPDGQGAAYGPYATAIAEMLRAPGLDMDGIFTRIRARTHETTQGALTPWYMSSLGEQIELVPPEAGAQAGVQAAPAAPLMRTPQPMRGISPEEAYALAVEMDTLNGYVEFVETYPRHPLTRRVYAIIRARREALAWMRARQIDTPPAYWTYLSRYPNGMYAFDAERRLRRLSASFQPPPGFGAVEFDVPPPIEGEPVEYVDAYEFRERPPRIMMAPPPAYIVDLPPPRRRTISPGMAAAAIALPLLAAPLIAPMLAPAPRRGPPPSNANFTPGASGGVGGPPGGGGTGQRWGNRGGQGTAAVPNQVAPTQVAPSRVTPNVVTPGVATPGVVTPGVVSPAPGTTPGVRQPPAAVLTPGTQPGAQPGTWPPGPRPAPGAIQPAPAPGTTSPPGVATRPPPGSLGVPPPGPRPQQPPAGTPAPSANVAPTTQPATQPGAQPGTQQRPGFQRPPGAPPPGVAVRTPPGAPPPGVAPRPPGSPPPPANTNINRPPPPALRPPPAIANRPPPSAPPPAMRQAPPPQAAPRPAPPPPQVVNRPPPAAAPPPPRPAAPPPPPPPRVAAPPPPRPPAPPPAAAKPPQCPPGKTFKDGGCK